MLETRLCSRPCVTSASAYDISLANGTTIPTRTVVWSAGNQPNPLLAQLPYERNRAGAVVCEPTLRVAGATNVWAVGDCAEMPAPDSPGAAYPPTAQHALRAGKTVAENVVASMRGKPLKPFRFKTIGMLVALGHRTAAAEVRGRQFSGLLAWFMWRGIYWGKLPGSEKKLRVALDWAIDLVFPRDIVMTGSGSRQPPQPTNTEAGKEAGDDGDGER